MTFELSNTTNFKSTSSERTQPIAADISILESASSFIIPQGGLSCPRAPEAFDAIVTAYCNSAPLLLPLPGSDFGEEKIPLLSLWQQAHTITPVQNLELSPEGAQELGITLKAPITSYIEGCPYDVADWLQFQFNDNIITGVLTRGKVDALIQCAQIASDLLQDKQLPHFTRAMLELQKKARFREPRSLKQYVGSSYFPSFLHLCVAYVFSFCLRGWSYVVNLSQAHPGILYKHIWLRKPVLKTAIGDDLSRTIDQDDKQWFPWGSILVTALGTDTPLTNRSINNVINILDGIRDKWKLVSKHFLSANCPQPSFGGTSSISDEEATILKILEDVDIFPRYSSKARVTRQAEWLRTIGSKSGTFMNIPAELIASNLQPKWLRHFETAIRVRYRRDTFWDVFDDPGIRVAINRISTGYINKIVIE